jgi:hypothetical protein
MINNPDLFLNGENKENKLESPLMLTNHGDYQGTSKYLSNYQMFNKSGEIFLSNGYKRYSQFFECENDQYLSEFVDPLTTSGADNKVHLKGRYINGEPEGIKETHIKYKFLGKQDSREDDNAEFDGYENTFYGFTIGADNAISDKSEAGLAEQMVSYLVQNYLVIENLPVDMAVSTDQKAVQAQAQTQVQPDIQLQDEPAQDEPIQTDGAQVQVSQPGAQAQVGQGQAQIAAQEIPQTEI